MSKENQLQQYRQQPLAPNGLEIDYHFSKFEETMQIATAMARSGMVPRAYQNNPRAIVVAGSMGAKFGFDIHQSLANIANVNGTPSLFGDGRLAVCEQTGELDTLIEGMDAFQWLEDNKKSIHMKLVEKYDYDPEKIAFSIGRRIKKDEDPEKKEYTIRHYTIDMAKKAGLTSKNNWQSNPMRMLQMRARSYVLRDLFSDRLGGLPDPDEAQTMYSAEEFEVPTWQEGASGSFISEKNGEEVVEDPLAEVFDNEEKVEDTEFEKVDGVLEDDEEDDDTPLEDAIDEASSVPDVVKGTKKEVIEEDDEEEAESESDTQPEEAKQVYQTKDYETVPEAVKQLERLAHEKDPKLIKWAIKGEKRAPVKKKAEKIITEISNTDIFEGV
jgi:hypothetical protein